PAEEKIEITEEKIVPPVEETKLPVSSLGNLVVESEFIREEEPVKDFVVPEIPKIDEISKPIEESLEPPVIETKIEERLSEIVKEHKPKKIKEADPSTRNIDDLLRTLGTPIEETEIEDEIIEEETIKEITEAPKAEDITEEFFIKTEEKPEDKSIIEAVPEIIEEKLPSVEEEKLTSIIEENLPEIIEEKKLPEIIEEKKLPEIIEEKLPEIIEEKKLPDTPLAGDISDAELQKKVDSLIAEFKTESSKLKDEDEEKKIEPEEEKQIEEIKEPEPEITKIAPPQDIEEAQLSSALSSIFNSILTSENIKKDEIQEKHIIKDEVKDLHNEIVKSEKPAETIVPPVVEETKETVTPSISDVYSSARSFNDIFVQKDDVNKDIMRAEDVKQIQEMHEAKEESRVELKEGMQIPVSEESKHTLRETNGPNLTESGIEHDIRTSKIYTNGNPLKPYANGKNGNSTFHQVLEDNGLQKESKTSIFIILAIIIIALGLLFFAIFNSGIMGKENPSLNEKNYGLVKVKENKNEKYFYDNGKDKVYFQTDKGFTIQAGSFKDKETAIEKRKELMNKKVENVRIEELEKDNSTFYRVRIGMFTALDEAKKYSEKF
ncbi:MAG: SPOR domain-containing protein, partial [Bacteroidetes bacterium]|nr:SPOR domain-containing protein [Bacteroidota bacterium]